MTETGRRETTRSGSWLHQRRLKIALGIAVIEGIIVALEKDFSRWTLIIVSAPIIAFYLFAGRNLESDTGRQLAWIAAAAQAFAVILCVVALVIGAFVLIVAGVFAAIAVILLLGERPAKT
ncbi:MAG TPA: hypothetical protein VJT84_02115 [Gaiellaceae bacterium]|nr:hypothetical protein [Gaiellaceae bacterium]